MKFSFWPFTRRQKRFDLDVALAKAETVKPGEPLLVDGNPTYADLQRLVCSLGDVPHDAPASAYPFDMDEVLKEVAKAPAIEEVYDPDGVLVERTYITFDGSTGTVYVDGEGKEWSLSASVKPAIIKDATPAAPPQKPPAKAIPARKPPQRKKPPERKPKP